MVMVAGRPRAGAARIANGARSATGRGAWCRWSTRPWRQDAPEQRAVACVQRSASVCARAAAAATPCGRQRRDLGARRRPVVEVVLHAVADGLGQALLLVGVAQPALVGGIGDESGLDQHRRDVRRLEHHEPGVLHARAVHGADAAQRGEHAVGRLDAAAHRFLLRDVEQYRREQVVLVIQRHAALEVGGVLALGQPARRLVGRAAQRKHVHRRPADVAPAHRIRVHRDEHVRAELARLARAAAEGDEVIAVADQHGTHAGFRVDRRGKPPGDRERDVLFPRATTAERAGVLPAVARVHRDDEVPAIHAGGEPGA